MSRARKAEPRQARRFFVSGRVQGVGFRWFVEHAANELGVAGWTRNLGDGRVEVYATGSAAQLDDLNSALWKGPRGAQVVNVEQQSAPMQEYSDFRIEYFR